MHLPNYFFIILLHINKVVYSIPFSKLLDPDLYLTTPQIIIRHGYPAEVHTVQTRDGYLLQLHRIPYGKTGIGNETERPPILLFHGLTSSSHDWILNGPEKSLSYRLADAGYDVWLANMRGTYYSNGHIEYTIHQFRYWNFSINEIGIYDLPANVDYILHTTNHTRLVLISHSVGTTAFYIMASTLPEYATNKITFQISFSAISTIPHIVPPQILISLVSSVNFLLSFFQYGGFETLNIFRLSARILCNPYTSFICTYFIIFPTYGVDFYEYDETLTALYYAHVPAGSSFKTLNHFLQLTEPKATFQNYDYGEAGNLEHYGTSTPPQYNLSNIHVPVRIYYGENDFISTPIDCKILYQKLPVPLGLMRVNYDKFMHLDFLASKDINPLLNDDIIRFINNATNPFTGDDFIFSSVQQSINARDMKNENLVNLLDFEKEMLGEYTYLRISDT